MSEELKKDIEKCIERMKEEGYSGARGAAFAKGYLHGWTELEELLGIIAGE